MPFLNNPSLLLRSEFSSITPGVLLKQRNKISPMATLGAVEFSRSFGKSKHFAATPGGGQKNFVKDFSEIPGPKPLPFIGNTLYTFRHKDFDPNNYYKFWESVSREFGGILKLKILGMPTLVGTTNPDDVEVIFRSTMDNPVRIGFESLKAIRINDKDNYFNKKTGILPEQGEEWWRVRSRVQGPLLRPRSVATYLPAVDRATLKFMDRISLLQEEAGHVPDDFLQELYKWALECIGLVALNRELGCLEPDITPGSLPMQLIKTVNDLFSVLATTEMGFPYWEYFRTPAYARLEASHRAFLELARGALEEAEARLEEARRKGGADRKLTIMETFLNTEGLSRSDVATIILDMIFAGIDTTSHTVAFALYLLARNPEVQQRVQLELDSLGPLDGPLTPDYIAALNCVTHVIKETLRLYPLTFSTARILSKDVVLSGYRVPAGTLAMGFTAAMSRMEEHFPHPEEFLPQRWGRDRPLGEIHPYASLPFSHGTRVCVGRRVAMQEMAAFLIRALSRYTVTLDPRVDMEVATPLVLKPVCPLPFRFVPRA